MIYKASGTTVPDLQLAASEPIPVMESMRGAQNLYRWQGHEIVEKLTASLPGGTLDAVLYILMEQKASMFKVPHNVRSRHELLHTGIDELIACWMTERAEGKTISNTTVEELLRWSASKF